MEEEVNKLADEYKNASLIGLRYGNVYGTGESHKNRMVSMIRQIGQQMLYGSPKIYKYGEQKRDFIYIKDVINAIIASIQLNESIIMNIGSGIGTTFNKIVNIFNTNLNVDRKPIYIVSARKLR